MGIKSYSDPFPVLVNLYKQTLEEVKDLPESASYKQMVILETERKLEIAQKNQTENSVSIENAILEAQDELNLLKKVKEWKPWEELEEKAPKNQWTYF